MSRFLEAHGEVIAIALLVIYVAAAVCICIWPPSTDHDDDGWA